MLYRVLFERKYTFLSVHSCVFLLSNLYQAPHRWGRVEQSIVILSDLTWEVGTRGIVLDYCYILDNFKLQMYVLSCCSLPFQTKIQYPIKQHNCSYKIPKWTKQNHNTPVAPQHINSNSIKIKANLWAMKIRTRANSHIHKLILFSNSPIIFTISLCVEFPIQIVYRIWNFQVTNDGVHFSFYVSVVFLLSCLSVRYISFSPPPKQIIGRNRGPLGVRF